MRQLTGGAPAKLLEGEPSDRRRQPQREQDAAGDTDRHEYTGFQERLPGDLPPAPAERAPHCELAPAIDRADHQKPGKVRKCNQQGERRRASEKTKGPDITCGRIGDRRRHHTRRRRRCPADVVQRGRQRHRSDAGRQTPDDTHAEFRPPELGWPDRKWSPQISVAERLGKPLRQHTDNRVRFPSEDKVAADRGGIFSELSMPERMADDGDPSPDIVSLEQPAKRRPDAEEREETGRDVHRVYALGRTQFREGQVGPVRRFEPCHRSRTRTPGLERGIAHRPWSSASRLIDRRFSEDHQRPGVRERWRSEQDGVNESEDRGARAERYRHRQHGGQGAGRRAAEIS